jgi:hypothetical protein
MASLKGKSAGLAAVNFSINGEQVREERAQEEANIAFSEAPVQQGTTYRIYKLTDTTKKGKYHMEAVDDVWNPEKNRMERIRLLTGFPSLSIDDQKHLEKSFLEKNRRSLIFDSRLLRVPEYDTAAIEFLTKCNANVDNPNKKGTRKITFFEWNPLRQAEVERGKRLARIEAIKFATMATPENMRKHANFLGIAFTDELGFPKSDDALRNDYEMYAESQPAKFMQSAGTPEVEVSYVVKKAILDNKIDLLSKPGSAYWASNGGFICKMPAAAKPQDYLVEYAMLPGDDSKQFLSQLQKLG